MITAHRERYLPFFTRRFVPFAFPLATAPLLCPQHPSAADKTGRWKTGSAGSCRAASVLLAPVLRDDAGALRDDEPTFLQLLHILPHGVVAHAHRRADGGIAGMTLVGSSVFDAEQVTVRCCCSTGSSPRKQAARLFFNYSVVISVPSRGLTQIVTQTRKKAGGYRRTQWIARRAESTQKRRKALRHNAFRCSSYLHTQEVTGSSPAVSTKKFLISCEIRNFFLFMFSNSDAAFWRFSHDPNRDPKAGQFPQVYGELLNWNEPVAK